MHRLSRLPSLISLVVAAFCLPLPAVFCAEEKPAPGITGLLLTWKTDPTTTMVIDWHEAGAVDGPVLEYRTVGADEWVQGTPKVIPFPHSDRMIFRSELTGLSPDTLYEFRPGGKGEPYNFRTAQANIQRPVRIAVGGDTNPGENFRKMNAVVADLDVDFIVWGGDYAYSNGTPEAVAKEHDWSEAIRDTLITKSRRVLPVIAAIGNHEISNPKLQELTREMEPGQEISADIALQAAPYYLTLFAFPGFPPYGVLDFGDYLSVVLLSTDHLAPIAGKQTDWLAQTLAERSEPANRVIFPIYHRGAYPTVRPAEGWGGIKDLWIPLFEKAGLTTAFEHHDHTYKRTHPMLGDVVQKSAGDGITYLGDGAWGKNPRTPEPDGRPFLAKHSPTNHAFIVEIPAEGPLKFEAVSNEGEVFDTFELPRRR